MIADTPTSRYGTDSPTLDAALWYAEELGVQVVALVPREKKPAGGGAWQHRASSDPSKVRAEWEEYPDRNVGMLLGERSGSLVDVDLDCDETRALAQEFLPETRAIFGRHGATRSHWLYKAEGAKHEVFQDPTATNGGGMLVEFRAGPAAHQTMVPPSIHPSGCAVGWAAGRYPKRDDVPVVDAAALRRRVAYLAAAALLVRYWPAKGSRRAAALALVGGLVRGGWSDERVYDFVHIVATAAGEGANLVERDVAATRSKLAADGDEDARSPSGWRALEELIPAEVVKRVRSWLVSEQQKGNGSSFGRHPYRSGPKGFSMRKPRGEEEVYEPLCNFTAQIVADVLEDDDFEPTRAFEIEASLGSRRIGPFRVGAGQFSDLKWVGAELGAGAVLRAGPGIRDHVRCAIQLLSNPVERRVYCHTGWRELEPWGWVYLHAGGAITAEGTAEVDVDLPKPLQFFRLPEPPHGGELAEAVRASLGVLEAAPLSVSVPVFAAVWRAALGPCAFSVHAEGASGVGKTELASLAQRFFGVAMSPDRLPGSWTSTGNALEALTSSAKDALLVVDDFAPNGGTKDVQRMHLEAERLLRSQGNQSGRLRMRADTSLRPAKAPRGMILSTGEDVPGGTSLRARQCIVSVRRGDIDWARLTACQQDASAGLYAQALSGFISWLAPHYRAIRDGLGQREHEERVQLSTPHARTATNVAGLVVGLRAFLRFAVSAGALSEDEADRHAADWWSALVAVGGRQAAEIEAADPALLFVRLVGAAIRSGRAHLTNTSGNAPSDPQAWGWRAKGYESIPSGACIGAIDEHTVYLDPAAALAAANEVGGGGDGRIPVKLKTLYSRLRDRGVLAETTREGDSERGTVTKRICGTKRRVIALFAETLGATAEQDGDDDA